MGISYEGPIAIGAASNLCAPPALEGLHARFVRYPGCQQLQLWLPRSGCLHDGALRVVHASGKVLVQGSLRRHLNGSVQLLMDTLRWPPGEISVEIDHDDGVGHRLALNKLDASAELPAPTAVEAPPPAANEPIVYRDGFGRPIENLDLALREKVRQLIGARFSRRLEYAGNVRSGVVTYVEGSLRIDFPHEMCGGELMYSIDIPTVERWEAATGTPPGRRDEIVDFVAERVRSEQAPSCRYRITANAIDYYQP